jgi:ADP-heptose:LPS heptosyltransferase
VSDPERILFVELWRLGDAVCATAGLRALRQVRPDAEIAVLAHPATGDPLFRADGVNLRIPFDAFWTRGKLWHHKYLPWTINYGELLRVRREIRRFDADTCLLFRGDVREQWFLRSAGVRRLVDFAGVRPFPPGLTRVPRPGHVPRYKEYVHLVRAWSGCEVDARPRLDGVTPPAPRPHGDSPRHALVNPGASWRYKQWSAGKFAGLIEALRRAGRPVRMVGTPADEPFMRDILARLDPGAVEVSYPSIEELYALTAGAAVVICNNSAAFHIAEALGTPAIVLTGSSDPVRWGTYRAHSRTLVKSVGLPCHPCREKRCVRPWNPCIEDIDLGDVLDALAELDVARSSG